MSRKTENLELNVEYVSPSTQIDMKNGYDENFNILDDSIQLILGTLENTDIEFSKSIDLEDSFAYKWVPMVWGGISNISGSRICKIKDDYYYIANSTPAAYYKLNISSHEWNRVSDFPFYIDPSRIWHFNGDTYYSHVSYHSGGGYSSIQKKFNNITNEWEDISWVGFDEIDGPWIWRCDDTVYYSHDSYQYILNLSDFTCTPITWHGLTSNLNGSYVWSDGDNIYSSRGSLHYVLNKETLTWESKTWYGLTTFHASYIWTDGNKFYYSYPYQENIQYVLDKETSTWVLRLWSNLPTLDGGNVWSDGINTYYSSDTEQDILIKDLN